MAFDTIAIVGAGALGGYYGARLAQHGRNVHFLLRSDYEIVAKNGLTVRSCDGDFLIPPSAMHAHNTPNNMPHADLVIVTLKATSNESFQSLIAPLLKEDTAILTIQNGLGNEDDLARLFGPSRVLGGMAFVCINRISPGVIHHLDHGMIRLGEFGGGPSPRATAIADMFRCSKILCEVLPDLRRGRWEKLVWNIPFNGLGAALDLTTDRLIDTNEGRQLVVSVMEEVIRTAAALGIQMPADMIDRQITHTRTMGAYQSSMQVDRRQGRPLEVEAILGEPLRQAQAAGVDTPGLRVVYDLCRVIAAAQRPITGASC
jgi:2-dehydropantoate 2-reductase